MIFSSMYKIDKPSSQRGKFRLELHLFSSVIFKTIINNNNNYSHDTGRSRAAAAPTWSPFAGRPTANIFIDFYLLRKSVLDTSLPYPFPPHHTVPHWFLLPKSPIVDTFLPYPSPSLPTVYLIDHFKTTCRYLPSPVYRTSSIIESSASSCISSLRDSLITRSANLIRGD